MGYCFMRIEKLKSTRELTKSYRHNYRLQPVPNADILAATNNKELVCLNGKTYQEAFNEDQTIIMKEKLKKENTGKMQ